MRERHCRLSELSCYRQRTGRVIESDASLRWVSAEVLTVSIVCNCSTDIL